MNSCDLELHVMRTLTSLQSESLVEVLLQHGHLLDALHQLSIHSSLRGLALLRNLGLLIRSTSSQPTLYSLVNISAGLTAGALK